MPSLPPHVSPEPSARQPAPGESHIPEYSLTDNGPDASEGHMTVEGAAPTMSPVKKPPPPDLISPAITPPLTPSGSLTPASRAERPPSSIPVASDTLTPCALLPKLPEVECLVRARIPTVSGSEMFLHLYSNNIDNKEHLAIVFGSHIRSRSLFAHRPGETERDRLIRGAYDGRLHVGRSKSTMEESKGKSQIDTGMADGSASKGAQQLHDSGAASSPEMPLVRIHSECYTGETAWSARCDCGEQLDEAARLMSLPSQAAAGGVIVYLRQEGRGIGLGEKLKAYNLQDLGSDTVEANLLLRHPADARSYGLATAILQDLGLGGDAGIRLLTNNPDKVAAVEGPNREVVVRERVAMVPLAWKQKGKGIQSQEIEQYLRTKIGKMGHMLDGPA